MSTLKDPVNGTPQYIDSNHNAFVTIQPIIQPISITTPTGFQGITLNGCVGIGLQITSIGGGATLVFEGSGDNVNWAPMNGVANAGFGTATGTTATGAWQFDAVGVPYFRVRATALTSGTVTGAIIATANGSIVSLEQGSTGAGTSGSETALVARIINQASTLTQSSAGAANGALTVTLPAAGAGLFHYITGVEITRVNGATVTTVGTPLSITTTNLQGARKWTVGNLIVAGGTLIDVNIDRSSAPLKSVTANTSTTIVMPVPGTTVQWQCNVDYYVGT